MMEGLYFKFSYSSSYDGPYASFWQISQESYERNCSELRSKYPWKEGKYDDGKSRFVLIDKPEGIFREEVYPKECHDITHPGILAVLAEIKAEEEAEAKKRAEERAASRKEYARNCGRVAKKLGISFVNVLRMGYEDEEALKAFQASLIAAKRKLAAMSDEKREYFHHEIFECGRSRISSALAELGVKTFNGDVRYMDFSELEGK